MRIWTALAFCCLLGCGGSSSPNNTADDLALQPSNADAASSKLPFGAACTADVDCATGSCFIGAMQSFCTMPCTAATQTTDCPAPPTSGTCNMRGFCKP